MEETKIKAKRKLRNIDFSGKDSHLALVHKDQGGPASGADYKLVLKNVRFTDEYIQKMQQVKVVLELPEFLQKFFSLYGEDAQVLARMMGYVPPAQEVSDYNYEDYIQSKLESFEVLKSVYDAESISEVLSGLDETQYLSMLNDQFLLEKAFRKLDKELTQKSVKSDVTELELVASATEDDTSTFVEKFEVNTSEVTKSKPQKATTKETQMTEAVKVEDAVEMVEKAQFVNIQKALDEQRVELQKALDTIAVFQKDKLEMIQKSKTAQFTAVIKDEKLQAPIVKAALSLESDDDFTAFLAAITSMATNIETSQEFMEKSALFQEQGATVADEAVVKESAVARILKAKQTK